MESSLTRLCLLHIQCIRLPCGLRHPDPSRPCFSPPAGQRPPLSCSHPWPGTRQLPPHRCPGFYLRAAAGILYNLPRLPSHSECLHGPHHGPQALHRLLCPCLADCPPVTLPSSALSQLLSLPCFPKICTHVCSSLRDVRFFFYVLEPSFPRQLLGPLVTSPAPKP